MNESPYAADAPVLDDPNVSQQVRALARFRVLDLTRALAGPACTRQLADWGADVIKIEVPTKDPNPPDELSPRHGFYFQNVNRNKRCLTLNLRDPRGRDLLYRLAKRADVLVENLRPSVKHRLGIDYETMNKRNPRLVYASISGFGQDGPYAERPGFDQIIQGMGGLMAVTGFPGQGPVRAGLAVSDMSAGLYCAFGILAALLEREVTGKGRWVRASLLEAMIAMMDFQAARWLSERDVPGQVGNDHPVTFPMGAYPTADSPINIAPVEQPMWIKFCEAIGRTDLTKNPDYANEPLRVQNKEALRKEITAVLKKHPAKHWIDRMNAAGVPCGPIYTMDQVFADPQVMHLKIAQAVPHPKAGRLGMVRQPVRLDDAPQSIAFATPDRGEHTEEILLEAGLSRDEIKSLATAGVV